MSDVEFEGEEITLGRQKYILPPLSFGQIKRLKGKLTALQAHPEDWMDVTGEALHAALSRNYPEMTLDEVEALIDLNNALDLFKKVMSVSGLEAQPGGAKAGSEET